MTRERQGGWASRRSAPFAYAGAWTLASLGYAGLFVASGAEPRLALRAAVAALLPNALLGCLSLRLARRWPWPEQRRWAGAARAVTAAALLAALASASWLVLAWADAWLTPGTRQWPPTRIVLWQSVINLLTQVALVGAGYAWDNGRRAWEALDQARRAEALHARAELQLLRTQLNPHFVLNTLHALLGLVRRDPAMAEAAIERLGGLLQFGMSVDQRRTDKVAFREEWAFVTGYLELERLRLGERLRLELRADPAAMGVSVPPFAIQPLVENAIAHGVAPRAAGGRLEVAARCDNGRLRVEVRDDGPGASEAAILASPRLGLRLLRERLAALYPGQATLAFESPQGGGLRVRLELPDEGFEEAL